MFLITSALMLKKSHKGLSYNVRELNSSSSSALWHCISDTLRYSTSTLATHLTNIWYGYIIDHVILAFNFASTKAPSNRASVVEYTRVPRGLDDGWRGSGLRRQVWHRAHDALSASYVHHHSAVPRHVRWENYEEGSRQAWT